MKEKCESCEIPNEVLAEYRGHNICSSCRFYWIRYEEREGRTIEFDEYRGGIKPKVGRNEEIRKQAREGKTIKELHKIHNMSRRQIERILRN